MRGLTQDFDSDQFYQAVLTRDVAIQNRLGVRNHKKPTLEAIALAKKWQPWRSYAVIRLWHGAS